MSKKPLKNICTDKLKGILSCYLLWGIAFILVFPSLAHSNSSTDPASGSGPKHVLILYSYGFGKPVDLIFDHEVRSHLESNTDAELNYFVEFLEWPRFNDEDYEGKLLEIFNHRYSKVKLDLVITFENSALDFVLKYRNDLFPGVPIVYALFNKDVEQVDVAPELFGVYAQIDIEGSINMILDVHPDTKRVVFVSGASPLAEAWEDQTRRITSDLSGNIDFVYLSKLPMDDLLKSVANQPEHTVVLYLLFFKDGDGKFFKAWDTVQSVARTSNVPVYGLLDLFLGRGIVGGTLSSAEVLGATTGDIGARILSGEDVQNIPRISKAPNVNMFDWRELQRWNISEGALPPGSDVRFRRFSFWEGYQWIIIGVLALIILEAILIFLLLLHRANRKKAEKALMKSESRYRTIMEQASVGIYITNREGKILAVNEVGREILGYTAEEIRELSLSDLIPKEDLEAEPIHFKKLLSGEPISRERMMIRKDGTLIHTEVNAKLIDGDRILGIVKDVSLRKKAEEISLKSSQLAAVGQIASGIAHEINNPLATISACAEVIKGRVSDLTGADSGPVEILEYIDLINDEVNRAAGIMKELLDFARVRPLKITEFMLCDLIKKTVHLLEIQSRYKDFSFHVSIDENLPAIKADRDRIRQVLVILLTNASEAMPEGGLIQVNCQWDDVNDQVIFFVTDSGIGIPEGEREMLFKPFHTTKLAEKGTGLGLSIADRIVTRHGGIIEVKSQQNMGSTFTVTLPVTAVIQEA